MADTQPPQEPKAPATQALLTCPKCGRANSQGTRYCIICGASLSGVALAAKAAEQASSQKKGGFFSKLFGRR
ncbi:MAG: zinc-ribbon domain-containing protein [Chloroflexi bacterium]|nr:zinc-ribbon domain-containing protein [Chloroflexota bacterium]